LKVAFRTDASLQIGTGHVMRCLTLAGALAAHGAECQFICRDHPGNLIEFIRSKGFTAYPLPVLSSSGSDAATTVPEPAHRHWLGATQTQDAEACVPILAGLEPDWLIIDHYALDARWELALAPHYQKLMVIDDLADRPHACDILLDQTYGCDAANYLVLVPANCRLLCGSQYALLRPEFAALRPYSLQRRTKSTLRELMINMGGVDKDNATGQVLQALHSCHLPEDCRITVVMGATAPWLEEVRNQAQNMPWPTRVVVGVSDMAQLMADSDLAIGAAGASAWERCCLGLPAIMLILAKNQADVARNLAGTGAAWVMRHDEEFGKQLAGLITLLVERPTALQIMSQSAMRIVDGRGTETVARFLEA
jgi:UDP-2,4-diacetamido-2,4,6-trideoxy-beta-L-altropyranose hydrolase